MHHFAARRCASILAAVLLVPLSACDSNGAKIEASGAEATPTSSAAPAADVIVFAAAPLADVFKTAGAAYERKIPERGSSSLSPTRRTWQPRSIREPSSTLS